MAVVDLWGCAKGRMIVSLAATTKIGARKVSPAVESARRKGADTDWTMYELIDRNPGLNVYELAKLLGWSTGKAHGSVKRLEKNGLVLLDRIEKGGKLVLKVTPIKWQEFFTPEELEEFKDMEF